MLTRMTRWVWLLALLRGAERHAADAEGVTGTGSRSCATQRPPFCSSPQRKGPAANWSCPSRAMYPDPCGVCYHGQCGARCTPCSGPLPPPPPPPPPPLPPPDWAARVAAAQMVFSNAEIKAGFTPALGNGFISGDAGCCTRRCQHCYRAGCQPCHSMCTRPLKAGPAHETQLSGCGRLHIAGVFNGALGGSPPTPNRASISNPHSVYVEGALQWIGGALDFERGIFYNSSLVVCPEDGKNATITLATFHHRLHRNLQVLSIAGPDRPCTVRLGNCSLSTESFDFNVSHVAGGGRRLEVLAMEQPNDPPHLTAVATMAPPPNCSQQPPPFCRSGNPADPKIYSCAGCGTCLNCLNCTACTGPQPLTPPCDWPKPPEPCSCVDTPAACGAHDGCSWSVSSASCKPKGWRPATVVGAAATPVPSVITFSASRPTATYLAVYRSSLEDGINASSAAPTAVRDLATFAAMDPKGLLASHVAEWATLWESGVEVAGNLTVASTVNATFYAILSSLRDDTPLGCSPSGLARNEYEGHAFW
eukprot:COSAG04_NODE_437_length_14435_cov_4.075126_9_plen_534_part_00